MKLYGYRIQHKKDGEGFFQSIRRWVDDSLYDVRREIGRNTPEPYSMGDRWHRKWKNHLNMEDGKFAYVSMPVLMRCMNNDPKNLDVILSNGFHILRYEIDDSTYISKDHVQVIFFADKVPPEKIKDVTEEFQKKIRRKSASLEIGV